MVVIKRSGGREKFSMDKLSNSLRYANHMTGEDMDVDALAAEVNRIVDKKDIITAQEIEVILCGVLNAKGFFQTLIAYSSFYHAKDA